MNRVRRVRSPDPMGKSYVLVACGFANGFPSPVDTQYVVRIDPAADARGGEQCMWFSPNLSEARRFASLAEAAEYWKTPLVDKDGEPLLRPDGKLDRPLTAFNVESYQVEE